MKIRPLIILTLVATLLTASWSLLAQTATEVVTVSGAYVRAVPPGQSNSAAFLRLSNGSGQSRYLVAARSPAAAVVELHSHSMEGGMMRMRPVAKIEVPANGGVELAPGGLHLMLIGLKGELAAGSPVPLVLVFDDGSELELGAAVRSLSVEGALQHRH